MPEVTKPPARKGGDTGRARPAGRGTRSKRAQERKRQDWRESVRFWFWAILIVLVLRAFLIEPYRIPTPSMERTLLVGDFLFVSKLHYGPRTPNTIGIPFTGVYLRGLELPQTRIPGFGSVRRGDVAVFNHPPDPGPIERRTPYIKRLVAMPGDRIVILDKVLYVNDERYPLTDNMMQHWQVQQAEGRVLTPATLERAGFEFVGQLQGPQSSFIVNAGPGEVHELSGFQSVGAVQPWVLPEGAATHGMYPTGAGFNRDNYGPLEIPARGETVELTAENWPVYRDLIVRYERRQVEQLEDGSFRIDGQVGTTYTFEQDYYFAMGDNRDNSEDSRFWGPVPHDHLVGKAVLIFFSLDFERPLLGFIPRLRLRGFQPIR